MKSSINIFSEIFLIFFALVTSFSACTPIHKPAVALLIDGSGLENRQFAIAVLPVENISGTLAPLNQIRNSLINVLKHQGLRILDEDVIESFMAKHRVRYTGGLDKVTAQSFSMETEAAAVLITSLELYDEYYSPKISLFSRLASTGNNPEILWMDSIGLSGDDSPKLLGLGLISDTQILLNKAIHYLTNSLQVYLAGKKDKYDTKRKRKKIQKVVISEYPEISDERDKVEIEPAKSKFSPKIFYRSPVIAPEIQYTVTVAPFLNRSERKNAGKIMSLHFIRNLKELDNFHVIEPGIAREEFLKWRIIMEDGISLANADIIFRMLNADLILTGSVMDYQDYKGSLGKAKVDFSTFLIERKSREVVWTSKSYNSGSDGVVFFDLGKINTAHSMASEMVKAAVNVMIEQ